MRLAHALLKLTRLDSSSLISLSVFVPLLARTKDLGLSLSKAIPLLFIGMCTFIVNDLDDIEKDRINHPERPLPSCQITPPFAAVLYFACLVAALFTTRLYVETDTAFWYYFFLTLTISYGYVVEYLPGFKSPYVAGAISAPVMIVATSYPGEKGLYLAGGAVFFFVLARELCMDILDRAGDVASFVHKISPKMLAIAAFSSQAIGLLLLTIQAEDLFDIIGLSLTAPLIILSGLCWFKLQIYKTAIFIMKLQLFVGLCFLV